MGLESRHTTETEIEFWLRDWQMTGGDWSIFMAELVHICAVHFHRRLTTGTAARSLVLAALAAGIRLGTAVGKVGDGPQFTKAAVTCMQSALKFSGFRIERRGSATTSMMLQAITRLFTKGDDVLVQPEAVLERRFTTIGEAFVAGECNAYVAAVDLIEQAERHVVWALLESDAVPPLIERRAATLGLCVSEARTQAQPLAIALDSWICRVLDDQAIGVQRRH